MSQRSSTTTLSNLLETLSKSQRKELLQYMSTFLTNQRRYRLNQVLNNRTSHFCVVLEDLFYERNSGAIIRTAEGYGIQYVHVIEPKDSFKSKVTNIVSKGSEKWISKKQYGDIYNGAQQCIDDLRLQGYQIVATTPHIDGCTIHDFDISKRSAFFLGSEKTGISDIVLSQADAFVSIPIYGFIESFNVSVANAILLHELMGRLRMSNINWRLSDKEREGLLLDWTMKSVVSSTDIALKFIRDKAW